MEQSFGVSLRFDGKNPHEEFSNIFNNSEHNEHGFLFYADAFSAGAIYHGGFKDDIDPFLN